jgi:glycerophosphoryl diester phosphodiesterase
MGATPRIFAHRGFHSPFSTFPESSHSAYMAAIEVGADGFECDIRLTKDHEIVIWHDATLQRIANNSARISTSTLDELRSIYPIMTLEELLDLAIVHKKDLAVETKHPVRYRRAVEKALARLLNSRSAEIKKSGIKIYLMSFSWWATSYNSQSPFIGTFLVRSRIFLPLARFATSGLNIQILREGYIPPDPSTILVWTVNEPEDIHLCKKIGVQVIITDNVSVAKSV